MKLIASLVALVVAAAPSAAVAGRDAHVSANGFVISHPRPVIVRPASPFLTARPRPLFLDRPLVVQRPFVAGQPAIVQQQVVVPRSSVFFTVPGTIVIVR